MIGFTFLMLSILMMISGFIITRHAKHSRRMNSRYLLIIAAWTAYIIAVVESGVLLNQSLPLVPLLLVIPSLIIILYATSRKAFKTVVSNTPIDFPVYVQSFRFLVELMIYGAFLEGVLPIDVTFKGANFDILVGVSAPAFAFLIRKRKIPPKGILIWNTASLLILATTVFAFVSTFYFSGSSIGLAEERFMAFPYILLPAVLVPFAVFYHAVSIRQCLNAIGEQDGIGEMALSENGGNGEKMNFAGKSGKAQHEDMSRPGITATSNKGVDHSENQDQQNR